MTAELWRELGDAMRSHRTVHALSLRNLERVSGWSRGTLSQVETGKVRPSLRLVEYYDNNFGGDGLLLALFADAHVLHGAHSALRNRAGERIEPGDAVRIVGTNLPHGAVVAAGEPVQLEWTITNTGSVAWRRRHLRRVGALSGMRLITSASAVPIPDTGPGDTVTIEVALTPPGMAGTTAAHWRIEHADCAFAYPQSTLLTIVLVVA